MTNAEISEMDGWINEILYLGLRRTRHFAFKQGIPALGKPLKKIIKTQLNPVYTYTHYPQTL